MCLVCEQFLTFVNHRLNGKSLSGLHDADCLVFGVVGHVWGAVEQFVNSCTKTNKINGFLMGGRFLKKSQ